MKVPLKSHLRLQKGAALLEATLVLPIILGTFAIATDTAQLLLKQAAFIDASNQVLRGFELPQLAGLSSQGCSATIKSKVMAILPHYGVRISDQALSITTNQSSENTIDVTLTMENSSLLGSIVMTQNASIDTSNADFSCRADSGDNTSGPPGGGINVI